MPRISVKNSKPSERASRLVCRILGTVLVKCLPSCVFSSSDPLTMRKELCSWSSIVQTSRLRGCFAANFHCGKVSDLVDVQTVSGVEDVGHMRKKIRRLTMIILISAGNIPKHVNAIVFGTRCVVV